MADPLTIISTGLKGLSLLGNLFGGSSAKKKAKRQAAEEARIEGEITAERVRQIDKEEEVLAGTTVARTAGSGVKVNSASPLEILADQAFEFERERAITESVGASKARAALDRGSAVASQIDANTIQSSVAGLSSIFSVLQDNKKSTRFYWGK